MGLNKGILIALILFSCQQKATKPDRILSQDQMVSVLSEVYITEEKISRLSLSPDSATQLFKLVQGRMFEKLNVPDSIFRESVDYYTDRPDEMEMIYSALVDSLQLREQRTAAPPTPIE